MEKLSIEEKDLYLKSGPLSEPFLPNDFVLSKVMCDYNAKVGEGRKTNIFESLFRWIHQNVGFGEKDYNDKFRFGRTASEIWESKISTSCTDYALLFSVFARQIGIPTTILHTAEFGWLERLQKNGDFNFHQGHSFCECFYNDKWILVDPTSKKIEWNYDAQKIELSYTLGGSSTYIPYKRCLDLGKRMTTREHNQIMDKTCKELIL